MSKKVTAVLVTFNRLQKLKQCIECLKKQSYSIEKIMVINNASTDGTTEYLNDLKSDNVIVHTLNENIGGAGGFSLGTKLAYETTSSDYFWVMDDDTYPSPSSLSELVKTASSLNDDFGFLSSNVQYSDGLGANCPQANSYWNEYMSKGLIRLNEASFVSLFYSREAVKNVGLPISEMFIWGDDFEYTTRINRFFNNKSYFVISSVVEHNSNNTKMSIFDCPESFYFRYRLMYRNGIFSMKHNFGLKDLIKMIIGNTILSFKALFKSKNHKFTRSFVVVSGTIKGIFFTPKVKYPKKER